MSTDGEEGGEATYPVRVAARVTGLKPELIRAWETRYNAVRPTRTAGGSRRYSDADLTRLKLLRDVVDSGHRIGKVADLELAELRALLPEFVAGGEDSVDAILSTIERLDAIGAREKLDDALSNLGAVEFATKIALPLLREIGRRWERGELSVSAEHLASATLRSMLTSALGPASEALDSLRIVFATPSGERHDLGTLVAALVAIEAGADAVFLGADVPSDDLVGSVASARASALVLGIVTLPEADATRVLGELRSRLPEKTGLWIGGAGIETLAPIAGIERIGNLDQLSAQINQLILGGATQRMPEGQ